MKEPGFFNGFFILSFFEEPWLYMKIKSLIFFENFTYESKEPP
jgi:hypothetical protein